MSTRSDPALEATAAALLMMARTTSYVPKELPLPSFSLDLTDSSQEETQTQKGVGQAEAQVVKSPKTTILIEELDVLVEKIAKSGEKTTTDFPEGKSLPTKKQTVGQIFDKFETPTRRYLMSVEMRKKCYLWATRIRTYADDTTDEYDEICTLNTQQLLVLSRVHFVSLKATSYNEADIVTAICLILNQQNIKRFQEEIYCLPPNIVNMAIGNHLDGVFLQPKSKKPFNVEDYPMFIPFFGPEKISIIFIWFIPEAPLKRKDREIEPPYIDISGQKTDYDCAIYVMKWLEIIEPQNAEVDHFRVEFASQILFQDMNSDRDSAIKESETMRLSKPFVALLSPYCQVDSYDIESDSD
ncbi:hypothetical protein Ahy_B03g067201 [Arachis hypogaea]|uniref:Ubiquitin-like protease family profile domain-containing protein n=1 Tax=Arachis hypogaea TaxID=3818 RepID=A0A445A641_ARAHY|nr:hypothetical protein Ahy_B03g067201 [Arachis hypogaea]